MTKLSYDKKHHEIKSLSKIQLEILRVLMHNPFGYTITDAYETGKLLKIVPYDKPTFLIYFHRVIENLIDTGLVDRIKIAGRQQTLGQELNLEHFAERYHLKLISEKKRLKNLLWVYGSRKIPIGDKIRHIEIVKKFKNRKISKKEALEGIDKIAKFSMKDFKRRDIIHKKVRDTYEFRLTDKGKKLVELLYYPELEDGIVVEG
ncbi:MAG: hypothetical protein NT129_00905 [Candidatus Aenigmarchaeota archaeon]|nr:hypothetical protein [Candidatus Aenigmarchaeota archaeon]